MHSAAALPFTQAVVTGAAGFLGSALAGRLAGAGVEVTAMDLRPVGVAPAGLHAVRVDLLDAEALGRALAEIHPGRSKGCVIFHLAAQPHVDTCRNDPRRAFQVNVIATLNVLEAARLAEVNRVVFASTGLVYRRPQVMPVDEEAPVAATSLYTATKLGAEYLLAGYAADYGLGCTVARLGNVFGAGGHSDSVIATLISQVLAGAPLTVRSLAPVRDFVFRDDVCDGLIALAALEDPGFRIVNLATGIGTSIGEVAAELCRVASRPQEVHEIEPRSADAADILVLSIDRIAQLCGWRPAYSLEAGLLASLQEQ